MSAFEIKMTPPRFRNKNSFGTKEPTDVIMAPFSSKSIVLFEEVPVTKTAKRLIRVINPSDNEIQVTVCKSISPELNVSLEWQEKPVQAQSEILMEMVWSPQTNVSCKETLQLIDNRNFRKDVVVILKSKPIKQVKNTRKFPTLSSGNHSHVKTLRLKSPTSATNKIANKLTQQHTQHQSQTQRKHLSIQDDVKKREKYENNTHAYLHKKRSQPVKKSNNSQNRTSTNYITPLMERNVYISNRDDMLKTPNFQPLVSNSKIENVKENFSPLCNMFNIIDELKFTPATEAASEHNQSELKAMTFLSTPFSCKGFSTTLSLNESKKNYVTDIKPRCLSVDLVDDGHFVEDIQNDSKGTTMVITNKTFEVKSNECFEVSFDYPANSTNEACSMDVNKTTVICTMPINRHLDIIQEEEKNPIVLNSVSIMANQTVSQTPQKCEKDLKRDIELVGTPLRKYSNSMKNLHTKSPQSIVITQGSLPNLNNMESIKSFENNRYFTQSPSHTDVKTSNHFLYQEAQKSSQCKYTPEKHNESLEPFNYGQACLMSQHELLFNQNEILAQSSRFNLNEVGVKNHKTSPNYMKSNICSRTKCNNTPPKAFRRLETVPESQKRKSNELFLSDSQSMDSVTSGSSTSSLLTKFIKSKRDIESPPKRQKVEKLNFWTPSKQNTSPKVLHVDKVKNWSQVQPKKLKLSKTLSLIKKPVTPRKLKEEPRIKLYEADLYLKPYINPDPFAATTTIDPFLTSTMYLDEASVEQHQTDLKKWLNALVTIPADLDTDSNAKIDVGKLFNEVRHKDLVLAPTKEEQSINFLDNFRLEYLRKAAVQLFLSEEMRAPCSKVAVYIQKNALRIRSDRNLHLDVVTQRDILELLLCFNPLWLRLGLEVVYGEKIQLQSNKDIFGLSSFILNRLFRDKFLEQKYSKAYTLSDEYAEHIKKFTLQKFLFLLLFLDRAKEKRIIAHNPCLFIKKSPHKETREILLRFASELLANLGDITRELKRLGYSLTHRQTYLDEFDYAFNNLAVDLRDGVRLTRVMEIILLRNDLNKQLRVPAISRLQRVFNVNLAIKALQQADFQLSGNIKATDIVDGHREKTLSLLWQIIYKFRSPKFHAAARTIQNWWRLSWLRVVINRRIRLKEQQKLEVAATKIQAAYRGLVARRMVKSYKHERNQAAIVFQKYIRRYLARKHFLKLKHCTIVIQKRFKSSLMSKICRENFLRLRESALCLQQRWRSRMLARVLLKQARLEKTAYIQRRIRAASIILAYWRGYKARTEYSKTISAVLVLQRYFRGYQEMKKMRESYLKLKRATCLVQNKFRAKLAMKKQKEIYETLRFRVIYIQRVYRANVLMRQQRKEYLDFKSKVVKIQQKWRATLLARKLRVEFLSLQYYTLVVQQKYRATKVMQVERKKYLKLQACVINIQRRFRAKLHMRKEHKLYLRKLQAIKTIQSYFKAHKKMRYQKAKYKGTKEAVLCIQRYFRGFLQMKKDREKFLLQKTAAITIQRAFRSYRKTRCQMEDFQRTKKAVICIQIHLKATIAMRAQRKEFLKIRNLIIFVQNRIKAKLLGRKVRKEYLLQRAIIISIQKRYRGKQLMIKEQKSYQLMRQSAICIQNYYRSYLLTKKLSNIFQQKRTSAIKIQTWYRAILQMRQQKQTYLRIRYSAIKIQRKWRATLKAREQKSRFLETKQKVIYLQRLLRATLAMRQQRHQYHRLRNATIVLQKRYRARREMLQIRSQYQLLRSLIICIQQRFRANQNMLKVRKDFLLLKSTVVYLQQKFRGRQKMLIEREHFLRLKSNIVDFQSHARGFLARRRFEAIMTPEMVNLLKQKKAAKIIQRFWRGYRTRKQLKNMRIKVIRNNIALLKVKSSTMNSIKYKVQDAVRLLSGRYSASDALHVLLRLERISRTVPHLLMSWSNFISTFCYGIMAQAIRSEIDKQLILNCSRIILNLARYNSTTANTFQEGGLVTIAQMLLRWCDKDCEIFNTLCTLIWIFAHCPVKRKIIHDFMTTTDAIYMVRETKKLVARKEKMKQNVRKPAVNLIAMSALVTSPSPRLQKTFSSCSLPSREPDYGVKCTRPYTFISSIFAFETILAKLEIDIF